MTLIILGELADLNQYIKSLNSSRWSGNSMKQTETDRVYYAARMQKIPSPATFPTKIRYSWYSKNQRMDTDNVAFAKKFINDGLVKAKVLPNDGRRHVSGFEDRFFIDKEKPRVEVEFIE